MRQRSWWTEPKSSYIMWALYRYDFPSDPNFGAVLVRFLLIVYDGLKDLQRCHRGLHSLRSLCFVLANIVRFEGSLRGRCWSC